MEGGWENQGLEFGVQFQPQGSMGMKDKRPFYESLLFSNYLSFWSRHESVYDSFVKKPCITTASNATPLQSPETFCLHLDAAETSGQRLPVASLASVRAFNYPTITWAISHI